MATLDITRRGFLTGYGREEGTARVAAIAETCLARSGIDCQACRDLCPSEAIRFRPRRGGPFLPEIDDERCTGCGDCIGICPTAAISLRPRAMEAGHG